MAWQKSSTLAQSRPLRPRLTGPKLSGEHHKWWHRPPSLGECSATDLERGLFLAVALDVAPAPAAVALVRQIPRGSPAPSGPPSRSCSTALTPPGPCDLPDPYPGSPRGPATAPGRGGGCLLALLLKAYHRHEREHQGLGWHAEEAQPTVGLPRAVALVQWRTLRVNSTVIRDPSTSLPSR